MRERFLGLVDETLERYDFDGIELDWMRGPPYFRPGRLLDNLDTLTEFMRQVSCHRAPPQRAEGEGDLAADAGAPLSRRGAWHWH